MRCRGTRSIATGVGQRLSTAAWALQLSRIIQLPGDSVEQTNQTSLTNSAAEKRICRKGPEGIVADFRVGRRGASMYEVKIGFGFEDGSIEEDEPNVDPRRRL